ncbi:MAG: hypothetical protein E5V42_02165, partial [Mesorhizobium sp.]
MRDMPRRRVPGTIFQSEPLQASPGIAAMVGRAMGSGGQMGFDQYHEPAEELTQKVRTFARMITSLIEEAEAISWYEQRMSVEKDAQARAIMKNA